MRIKGRKTHTYNIGLRLRDETRNRPMTAHHIAATESTCVTMHIVLRTQEPFSVNVASVVMDACILHTHGQ